MCGEISHEASYAVAFALILLAFLADDVATRRLGVAFVQPCAPNRWVHVGAADHATMLALARVGEWTLWQVGHFEDLGIISKPVAVGVDFVLWFCQNMNRDRGKTAGDCRRDNRRKSYGRPP